VTMKKRTSMKRLNKINMNHTVLILVNMVMLGACTPQLTTRTIDRELPASFGMSSDTSNVSNLNWREFFGDQNLVALIDTALLNNQELNIVLQEIEIQRNEVLAAKGEYLPSVSAGLGMEVEKVGSYTRNGAVEKNLGIRDGEEFPEPLGNLMLGASASWEVDIWRKLRNARESAYKRYLSGVEGKNFLVTGLVAEIANAYIELLALDNQLELVEQNIQIQSNALEIVKLQKQAARVTELAVKRFEAQLLDTRSLQFSIQQQIVETENLINLLVGRFPQPVKRDAKLFESLLSQEINVGSPEQLLAKRPDIRAAELKLQAAKLDVSAAKANFYPSLGLNAVLGFEAFNPKYLMETPESLLYGIGGELMGPLINRRAIKAHYQNANAKQIQAIIEYEQTVLSAYLEIVNQIANIENLAQSYDLQNQRVAKLTESIDISINLFKSARAEYLEVLLIQEEALESVFELIDTRKAQLGASIDIYRALGGGWN
jgi:multidrug efflux system outer membrane protein